MSPDTTMVIALSRHALNWVGSLILVSMIGLILTVLIWRNSRE